MLRNIFYLIITFLKIGHFYVFMHVDTHTAETHPNCKDIYKYKNLTKERHKSALSCLAIFSITFSEVKQFEQKPNQVSNILYF